MILFSSRIAILVSSSVATFRKKRGQIFHQFTKSPFRLKCRGAALLEGWPAAPPRVPDLPTPQGYWATTPPRRREENDHRATPPYEEVGSLGRPASKMGVAAARQNHPGWAVAPPRVQDGARRLSRGAAREDVWLRHGLPAGG